MSRDLELTVLRDEVEFHRMMADRAQAALRASRDEASELRLKYEHLRDIISQALVKGRELCHPTIVTKLAREEALSPPRANCILNADSPSYPPETDEYRQCGCSSCRREYERRVSSTAT